MAAKRSARRNKDARHPTIETLKPRQIQQFSRNDHSHPKQAHRPTTRTRESRMGHSSRGELAEVETLAMTLRRRRERLVSAFPACTERQLERRPIPSQHQNQRQRQRSSASSMGILATRRAAAAARVSAAVLIQRWWRRVTFFWGFLCRVFLSMYTDCPSLIL